MKKILFWTIVGTALVAGPGTGCKPEIELQLTDEKLLDLVQHQTFKYFYDFADPASGMARERNSSLDTVTSGGTGFGIMALVVGMERGFVTRQEGIAHLEKILDFLESCDRFHGVWPHWLSGSSGKVIPFSEKDNGADLVETAFLVQGLLTMREYLFKTDAREKALKNRIDTLWQSVEWDWFTRGGEEVLYWHWSPDFGWEMNHAIRGHNETLITYVLAASSPTHPIDSMAYHNGYARAGDIVNGSEYYGIKLPLGEELGGPLFFSHYSFLGLDPRNLKDQYASYWQQNMNHTLINRQYCIENPKNYKGYSAQCWGLTASDNHQFYNAHSPTNDLGVITPTAAISSIPYTPEHSLSAIRHFYYELGHKLWGVYGFHDAFNQTENWWADSYLAIDQGPIVVMIENYRSGLLWELFMSAPEIAAGLQRLGFSF
ncbi:MAG: glucoamylase family protein [Bacteroidales bacterium]|nr:glucoamylase family protein [Bacteroidales bacterium]